MLIAKTENDQITEYPLTVGEVKERLAGVSFPIPFEPPEGYVVIQTVDPPQCGHHEVLREDSPRLVNGEWFQNWKVDQAPAALVKDRTSYMAATARTTRNLLLAETDWTQGKDIPDSVSSSWAPYRQALRDITLQDDFPFEVLWPEKPINNNQHS